MGVTLTQVLPLYREHYHENIAEIFFKSSKMNTPVLSAMESRSINDGAGRGYVVPIEYSTGSAISATFSSAQTKAQGATDGSANLRDRWVVQAENLEGLVYISRDAILGAKGDSDKLFDVIDREVMGRTEGMKKRLGICAVEQGFGKVGRATAVGSSQITLGTDEVNRLQIGDELVASESIDGADLRTTGNTGARVTGYNPDSGVVNLAVDVSGGGEAWVANDYIFFLGDRENAASPAVLVPQGLGAWVPETAPGATTFQGVNRQNKPELGGHRYAAGGADHATALIRSGNRLFQYGSRASLCVCSPVDYGTLCADKDAVKIVEIKVGKYEIGFDGVTVQTLAGRMPVTPDAFIEQGVAWTGPFDDKKLAPFIAHNDDLVNIDDIDGQDMVRAASSTNYEMRLYFRGNMIVPGPGKFVITTGLPTS